MTRLNEYAADSTSQFGENGCVAHIIERIGSRHQVAVEFGAGDGLSCSNVAPLWREHGWTALLVETDPDRFGQLEGNTATYDNVVCRQAHVTPTGAHSIAALAAQHNITGIDVMSIDIDGDDYLILDQIGCRPRIICIEFNPTVPPHVSLYPEEPGSTFGASLLAVARLAVARGYRFVGATYCNAFLVDEPDAAPFDNYETDLRVLLADRNYTYAVTDYAGRLTLCGAQLPWGARVPYVQPLGGDPAAPPTTVAQQIRRGFESLWGCPAYWLPPQWANIGDVNSHAPALLAELLADERPRLVGIDLTNEPSIDGVAWVWEAAQTHGYRPVRCGAVLALIRREDEQQPRGPR